jgi:hypothetical protein
MKIVSTSISTTTFSRAYLQRAWEQRGTLAEYERNGFGQFFYLTTTGHLEASMAEIMSRRVMYSRAVIAQLKDKNFSWQDQMDASDYVVRPIHDTLMNLLLFFDRKIEKAPLEPLIELFQDVFAIKLPELLGDAYQDLKALANLRNVFAHGRDFWLRFEQDEDNLSSLEKNPLLLPAQRLLAANVLTTLRFDSWTHPDFQRAFFSDGAMLYFLGRARHIEALLKNVLTFAPETQMPLMISLPELAA